MSAPEAPAGGQPPLWQLVPLAEHRLPEAPAAGAARARWSALKRLFLRRDRAPDEPVKAEADLAALPAARLRGLVAPIDWREPARQLDERLSEHLASPAPSIPVLAVVGAPHSGRLALLRRWAATREAAVIEAPRPEAVLAGGDGWLAAWPQTDHPWLLPRLEHCWLRHPAGLRPMRDLLAAALSGTLGPGVIGCDSWTWAFLRYLWPMPQVPALALQALDGAGLARLFAALAADAEHPLRFRHAHSGRTLLALPPEDADAGAPSALQQLAADCRGRAEAARTLWRARLRALPEAESSAERTRAEGAETLEVWVGPAPAPPQLPPIADETLALILHALLLHDGLPAPLLAALLPLAAPAVQSALLRLQASAVAAPGEDGRWRVRVAAYPPVRAFLAGRGYLTDDC